VARGRSCAPPWLATRGRRSRALPGRRREEEVVPLRRCEEEAAVYLPGRRRVEEAVGTSVVSDAWKKQLRPSDRWREEEVAPLPGRRHEEEAAHLGGAVGVATARGAGHPHKRWKATIGLLVVCR
jgi:hypothetical protein